MTLFSLERPTFSDKVLITSADDSIYSGQLKKLGFERKGSLWFALFELKVKKLCLNRVFRMLSKGYRIQAPLIKKVELSSGYSIYMLIVLFQVPEGRSEENHIRVLALDLSPSERRLEVGIVASQEGHSKPTFFKTELLRKTERLDINIYNLERKIDRIGDSLRTITHKKKEKLNASFEHPYGEQKLL